MWQYYVILGLGLVFLLLAIISFRNTLVFLKNGYKVLIFHSKNPGKGHFYYFSFGR